MSILYLGRRRSRCDSAAIQSDHGLLHSPLPSKGATIAGFFFCRSYIISGIKSQADALRAETVAVRRGNHESTGS